MSERSQGKRKKGGNSGKLQKHRAERAERARERQKIHDAMTAEEKFRALDDRPGEARYERAKLLSQM